MGSSRAREYETQMLGLTEDQMDDNEAYRKEQQDKLAAQKQEFKQFQFTNPFEGMENPFEDLTVNQESARFQMEQGTQQRANIMAGLRGSAGSSGIAGLAQSLANQGTIQARQVSADISQQEAANARMAAQGGLQVDMMQRQGAGAVQAAEFGREATLYAGELGELAGARAAEMGAYGNQMSALGMGASNASQAQASTMQHLSQAAMAKVSLVCIPKGVGIDCVNGIKPIENIRPGDVVIGYNGDPVKVLQKHEYLENPDVERFYKVSFKDGNRVDVCDMHRIKGVRAKDITEDVVSKEIYDGVEFSYDLLTEDLGYRISGIPVNSMIEEMANRITKLSKVK